MDQGSVPLTNLDLGVAEKMGVPEGNRFGDSTGPLGIPEMLPSDVPPTWMLVANDDTGAARTIFNLMPKLRAAGIPMEAHIYAQGGHAFNMGNRSKLKTISSWTDRFTDWMNDNYILDPTGREEYQNKVEEQKARQQRNRERSN